MSTQADRAKAARIRELAGICLQAKDTLARAEHELAELAKPTPDCVRCVQLAHKIVRLRDELQTLRTAIAVPAS